MGSGWGILNPVIPDTRDEAFRLVRRQPDLLLFVWEAFPADEVLRKRVPAVQTSKTRVRLLAVSARERWDRGGLRGSLLRGRMTTSGRVHSPSCTGDDYDVDVSIRRGSGTFAVGLQLLQRIAYRVHAGFLDPREYVPMSCRTTRVSAVGRGSEDRR